MRSSLVTCLAALLPLGACRAPLGAPATPWPLGTLVISNMDDSSATVIDAATGRVRATLPTGRGPHEVAASHDGRWAAVSNYGVRGAPGNSITVIDVRRATVARTIDLGAFRRPHGITFLPGDTTMLVTAEADQALLLLDFRMGTIVRRYPTKGRGSHMVAASAAGDRWYTANIADGSLSIIDPRDSAAVRTIRVARATEGVATTPDGTRAWLGSNQDSIVVVVDPSGTTPPDTLRGFGMPYRIAISPDGRLAIVTDPVRAEVRIFDARSHAQRFLLSMPPDSLVPTAEVPGSASPEGIAVSADSRWAFVTLQGRNRVIWIDLSRGVVARSAPTGTWSDGIAFVPAAGK